MAIVYTKLFQDLVENKLGLTRDVVRSAISSPEQEQKLVSQGLVLYLYLGTIRDSDDWVLVLTSVRERDLEVLLAFRLKQDLLDDANTSEPLLLLKAFAERFGAPITVGSKTAKFIVDERIPVNSTRVAEILKVPPIPDSFSSMFFRVVEEGGALFAQCALGFYIPASGYRAWAGSP